MRRVQKSQAESISMVRKKMCYISGRVGSVWVFIRPIKMTLDYLFLFSTMQDSINIAKHDFHSSLGNGILIRRGSRRRC